jgi:hypothetical protein
MYLGVATVPNDNVEALFALTLNPSRCGCKAFIIPMSRKYHPLKAEAEGKIFVFV